ncbi:restriction endonuclease subunit S [Aliikangiella sp. G2MR2-5]|uniref:restriction endonuclease subunit S n=1 Tax=Aliikangiella sp. G2MR2-5 TaxID=2788943 RepID=UPI0018ABA417|nr:restriction endonuclease subunit S [Aliikangiella sp. G2MR2-5]
MSEVFKKYPKYKDSSIEWLDEIPTHWTTTKLKYQGEAIIGLTYSPDDVVEAESDSATLVLRSSNVQNQKITLTDNVFVNKEIPEKLKTKLDDILICSRNGSRALIGKNARIDSNSAGMTFGAFMTIFRSKYNYYLSHVFNSKLFEYQSGSFLTSTINQLTTGNLNSFEIPFPPDEELKSIAAFLDHETAKIDTLIAKQEKLIELLKEKRQAVISHAVTKGLNPDAPMKDSGVEWLGEVPEHWETKSLKYLVKTRKGVAFKSSDFADQGTRVVKASDIKQLTIRTSEVYLPTSFVFKYPKAVLKVNNIILSTVGSNPDVINSAVGQVGKVPKELDGTLLNQNTVVFEPLNNHLNTQFLFYFLQTRAYRDHLDLHAHGTANQSSLNVTDMLEFRFSLPPLGEQNQIASYLNNFIDKAKTLEHRSQTKISLLKERKIALISAAVTGKIDVRSWQGG